MQPVSEILFADSMNALESTIIAPKYPTVGTRLLGPSPYVLAESLWSVVYRSSDLLEKLKLY